jgi:hypothetical protein
MLWARGLSYRRLRDITGRASASTRDQARVADQHSQQVFEEERGESLSIASAPSAAGARGISWESAARIGSEWSIGASGVRRLLRARRGAALAVLERRERGFQFPGALHGARSFPELAKLGIVVRISRGLGRRSATALIKRLAKATLGNTAWHDRYSLRSSLALTHLCGARKNASFAKHPTYYTCRIIRIERTKRKFFGNIRSPSPESNMPASV